LVTHAGALWQGLRDRTGLARLDANQPPWPRWRGWPIASHEGLVQREADLRAS
jgi:hypothetical protein